MIQSEFDLHLKSNCGYCAKVNVIYCGIGLTIWTLRSLKDNRELCSHVYTEVKSLFVVLFPIEKGLSPFNPHFTLSGIDCIAVLHNIPVKMRKSNSSIIREILDTLLLVLEYPAHYSLKHKSTLIPCHKFQYLHQTGVF